MYPHLCACTAPSGFPEDSSATRARVGEEICGETCAYRGTATYSPEADAEDEEPETDASTKPYVDRRARLHPRGSCVPVRDRWKEVCDDLKNKCVKELIF